MVNKLSRTCRRLELGEPEGGTACPGVGSAEAPPRLDAPSLSLERPGEEPGDGTGIGGNEVWKAGRGWMLRGLYLLSEGARHSSTGPEAPRNGFSRPVLAAMLRKGRVGDSPRRAGKAGDDAAGTKAMDRGHGEARSHSGSVPEVTWTGSNDRLEGGWGTTSGFLA